MSSLILLDESHAGTDVARSSLPPTFSPAPNPVLLVFNVSTGLQICVFVTLGPSQPRRPDRPNGF